MKKELSKNKKTPNSRKRVVCQALQNYKRCRKAAIYKMELGPAWTSSGFNYSEKAFRARIDMCEEHFRQYNNKDVGNCCVILYDYYKNTEWRRKHLSKKHKKNMLFQRTLKKAAEAAVTKLVVKTPSILKKGFGISYKKIK